MVSRKSLAVLAFGSQYFFVCLFVLNNNFHTTTCIGRKHPYTVYIICGIGRPLVARGDYLRQLYLVRPDLLQWGITCGVTVISCMQK